MYNNRIRITTFYSPKTYITTRNQKYLQELNDLKDDIDTIKNIKTKRIKNFFENY